MFECLRSVGLTDKIRNIIERGPPKMIAENFEKLFRSKIKKTADHATIAVKALKWEALLSSDA